MKISGNGGLASKFIPVFAIGALSCALLLILNSLWTYRADILTWAASHVLAGSLIFSMVGFAVCFWLALFPGAD